MNAAHEPPTPAIPDESLTGQRKTVPPPDLPPEPDGPERNTVIVAIAIMVLSIGGSLLLKPDAGAGPASTPPDSVSVAGQSSPDSSPPVDKGAGGVESTSSAKTDSENKAGRTPVAPPVVPAPPAKRQMMTTSAPAQVPPAKPKPDEDTAIRELLGRDIDKSEQKAVNELVGKSKP